MRRIILFSSIILYSYLSALAGLAGDGGKIDKLISEVVPRIEHSKFNLKLSPAVFWSTLGLEAEFVISPKVSISLNLMRKFNQLDRSPQRKDNASPYILDGYLAEIIGRYYLTVLKQHPSIAPQGFYIQASGGYNQLLYFDGSTRPYSLHTRKPVASPQSTTQFQHTAPLAGTIGIGYQLELVQHKVIANLTVGTQANTDRMGLIVSVFLSPSIGMMF